MVWKFIWIILIKLLENLKASRQGLITQNYQTSIIEHPNIKSTKMLLPEILKDYKRKGNNTSYRENNC